MKALSLTQPWASLLFIQWNGASAVKRAAKCFETRSWQTAHRGTIAIHASKGFPKWAKDICSDIAFEAALSSGGFKSWRELPLGQVIGLVNLVKCYPTNVALKHPAMTIMEQNFGDYGPGRFAWLFDNPQLLPKPIPAKGSLGLWEWQSL